MAKYSDKYTKEISFPLGGIGTGSIGISGNGSLIDWEIFNRPNRCSVNEYSHFAIKAENKGRVVDARILNGDIYKDFMGTPYASHHHSWGFGHGSNRTTLAGMAHFENVCFNGEFPIAEIEYKAEKMPAQIKLTAFNPFIPCDSENSSIPSAFFEWEIKNTSNEEYDYTIAFSCGNPHKTTDGGQNFFERWANISAIRLCNDKIDDCSKSYGELYVSTDCNDISYQEYWYRSGWFDDLTTFWREFSSFGHMKNRHYDDNINPDGRLDIGDMCTLCAHFKLKPNETKKIRFLLAWYFPNYEKYWDENEVKPIWKNYYAKKFSSAKDVTRYCHSKWSELFNKTNLFRKALYNSTIPKEALDAAGSNLAVLKSSTCLRLENGDFWAFEGVNATTGSCEGTCDHVWAYQYALAFLFPDLEKQVISNDYKYNMLESGEMKFRTMVPLGSKVWDFRACVDGQMNNIIRVYKLFKLTGNKEWLKDIFPKVKKGLEYAWSSDNKDRWDIEKNGVITGRQHHTLDVELFGANSWLTGLYIAALKASALMAEILGETDKSKEYNRIAQKGQKYVDEELFNGSYYEQNIDVKDKSILDSFLDNDENILNTYWNDEKKEIKYQYASGCVIDQVLGQFHSDLCGIGDIFDKQNRKTALKSLYKNNFKSMREVFNPCRIFAVNDEKGLVICEWADESKKPAIPLPYTEECMTGFEYAAAGAMLQNVLTDEGLECIKAVRERYDGEKRNPYSEIECGASYARSMTSYAFLAIYSGFKYDMHKKIIGFNPILKCNEYSFIWSVGNAWGTVKISSNSMELKNLFGTLVIEKIILPDALKQTEAVYADGKKIPFIKSGQIITFSENISLKANSIITIK